jgi:hypothetical protein
MTKHCQDAESPVELDACLRLCDELVIRLGYFDAAVLEDARARARSQISAMRSVLRDLERLVS